MFLLVNTIGIFIIIFIIWWFFASRARGIEG